MHKIGARRVNANCRKLMSCRLFNQYIYKPALLCNWHAQSASQVIFGMVDGLYSRVLIMCIIFLPKKKYSNRMICYTSENQCKPNTLRHILRSRQKNSTIFPFCTFYDDCMNFCISVGKACAS